MHALNAATPNGLLRNIQNHSTPLQANGTNSSIRAVNSRKRRSRTRRCNDNRHEIIDLIPKRAKISQLNDSDIEIVEPGPPTIIDLVEEESCDALTEVNIYSATETASDYHENTIIEVDSPQSLGKGHVDSLQSAESTSINDGSQSTPQSQAPIVVEESPEVITGVILSPVSSQESANEPVPLYVKDATGGGSFQTPLYDLVSDDSFFFDSPNTSQKTLVNDDSVIFVSETLETPKRCSQNLDFISINDRKTTVSSN